MQYPESAPSHLVTQPGSSVLRRLVARWRLKREQRASGQQSFASMPRVASWRVRMTPLLAAFSAAAGGSMAIAQTATNISPNGRTATQVQAVGNVLNVTTGTVAGGKAFNSFSRFEVGTQSTVNLMLPNGTSHLINLVYDAPIRVDGVLNSIKGNQIGGNVIFADPYGMIVGSRGVLNVGSLSAITPTRGFMDGIISTDGLIDPLSVSALMDGHAPRSADGVIRIDGRINALERVRLEGAQVTVNGVVLASAEAAHQEAFVRAVNANGLQQATGMVDKGGVIEIIGNSITVGGTLDASGRLGGGQIAVGRVGDQRAETVDVTPGATLRADAIEAGNGGTVDVWGTSHNQFQGTISVRGGSLAGDGGFAEVSGDTGLLYAGLTYADAAHGATGRLLIDPSVLCIVNSAADACSGNQLLVSSLLGGTANVSASATDTLYVGSSIGNTGASIALVDAGRSITLTGANLLQVNAGSTISTTGGGTISLLGGAITVTDSTLTAAGTGGAVNVQASAKNLINLFGFKNASSSVKVSNSTISADDVSITATTTIENKPFLEADNSASNAAAYASLNGTVGLLSDLVSTETLAVLQFMTGASVILSSVDTSAKVTIDGASKINGNNSVTISAATSGEAGNAKSYFDAVSKFLTPVQQTKFGLGVMYLGAKGVAEVNIGGTTKLTGGNLTVSTRNDITVEGEVETANTDGPGAKSAKDKGLLALAVGVAITNATANTVINSGVTIQSAGNVALTAVNYSNVSNSVTAASGPDGKAGAAVAYTQQNTSANVTLNTNIQDATSATILSIDHTEGSSTTAQANAGATPLERFKANVEAYASEDALSTLSQYAKNTKTLKASTVPLRIAGAVALTDETHNATTNIADGVLIHTQAQAGVDGSGTVLIGAIVDDSNITLDAGASAVTSEGAGASAKNAAAAAVAIGNYTHNAQALVGNNVTIVGSRIGVISDIEIPMKDMLDGSSLSADAWSSFGKVKDTLGMFNDTLSLDFVNARAHAKGAGDELGFSGSITLMSVANTSRAEVGSKTKLLTNSDMTANAGGTYSWANSYELVAEDKANKVDQVTADFNLNGAVAVQAITNSAFIVQSGEALSTNKGKGVGLSNGYVAVDNTTDALVREGVKIASVAETDNAAAAGQRVFTSGAESQVVDSTVRATNNSLVVNFTIGAGKSTDGGIAGMAVETFLTNHAVASLDNEAVIKAKALRVEAADTPTVYTIAGTVNMSSQTTIGVAVAINDVSTNTVAEIADNDLVKTANGTARTSAWDLTGQFLVSDLTVAAHTGGEIYGIGIAGSITSTDPTPSKIGAALSKVQDQFNKGLCAANSLMGQGDLKCSPAQAKQKADRTGWSVSGAGSVSVTTTDFVTIANLEGTKGTLANPNQMTNLHVNATGDANIVSVAGGAAITLGGKGSKNSGNATVAGAVAVNVIGNKVESHLADVTIANLNSVDVSALKGGENLSIGIGMAVSTDTTDKNSVGFAGAASVTLDALEGDGSSKNAARVYMDNAKLVGADTGDANIVAYNSTRIGTGGGSMTAQGKKSIGAAITYAEIGSDTEVFITNSAMTNFKQENVLAHSASQIVAAAASAAVSKGQTNSIQLTGAMVLTNISDTTQAVVKNSQLDGTDGVAVTARDGTRQAGYEAKLKQGSVVAATDEDGNPNGYSYNGSDLFTNDSMIGGNTGSSILGIAGVVQVSTGKGSSSVGASLSINLISNTINASVDGDPTGGKASSTSNLVVTADSSDYIRSVAAGVSVADDVSLGGSVAINRVTNTTSATINGASVRGASVLAQDNSHIDTLAGQINISKGADGTAVGGALAYAEIGNNTSATLSNATVSGGLGGTRSSTVVQADSNAAIRALVAAGAAATGSNGIAISGSVGFNLIGNTTTSALTNVAFNGMSGSADLVRVATNDHSDIQTLSGSASFGMKAGFGGAISTNTITNTNSATATNLSGSGVETTEVKTVSDGNIDAIAVGIAASSDKVSIAGSVTVNTVTNNNSAALAGSTYSGGSLNVSDNDTSSIDAISGAAAVSPSGSAIGIALSTNTITNSNVVNVTGSTLGFTGGSTIQAIEDSTIRSLSASGGVSEKVTVTGAASVNTIKDTTNVTVGTSTLTSVGSTILAQDDSTILNLSGAVAVSLNGTAVGVGASANTIVNTTSVLLDRAVINAGTGAASAQALGTETIKAIAASVAVSGGTTSISLAGSANTVTDTTKVESLGSSVSGKGVTLKASDTAAISAINGAASLSLGNVAVGGAIGNNVITNTTSVLVDNKTVGVTTFGSTLAGGTGAVVVEAASNEELKALAAAATGSAGNVSVSGSVVNSIITNTTSASVYDSVVTGASAAIKSSDTGTISSLGGSVAISFGTAAVGAAVVVNTITNNTKALADNTQITVTGAANVTASNTGKIDSIGAAGAVAADAAVSVSDTTNTIVNTTDARIANKSAVSSAGGSVGATDSSAVRTIAGAVALSPGVVAVGGALSTNTLHNTTSAYVNDSTLAPGAGAFNTTANSTGSIQSLAAAGAVSSGTSVAGSVAVNGIYNTTQAELGGASVTSATSGNIGVSAIDSSSITALAGSVAAGGAGSIGVAVVSNTIANTVNAHVYGNAGQTAVIAGAGDLTVLADSRSTIKGAGAGVAADANVGIAGTVVADIISTSVESAIDKNADVDIGGTAAVLATNKDSINTFAGAAGIGVSAVGIGAAAAVNVITGTTRAQIGDTDTGGKRTRVDAQGNGSGVTVSAGALTADSDSLDRLNAFTAASAPFVAPVLNVTTKSAQGVAVNALAVRTISSGGFALGASATVGIGGTFAANAVAGDTQARITSADINQRARVANASQDVDVEAASHTRAYSFTGSVGAGLVGIGGSVDGSGIGVNTTAGITDSNTTALRDINVKSYASEGAAQLDVGISGGFVGVQGSAAIAIFRGTTSALLQGGSASAGRDVNVTALHDGLFSINAGAAAGGVVGVAGAINVAVNDHTVLAQIGYDSATNTTVTAGDDIDVDAQSKTTIQQWSASAGGGGVAVALAATAAVLEDTATAKVNYATLTASDNTTVNAVVDSMIQQRGGSIALSAGGSVAATVGMAFARGTSTASVENSAVTSNELDVTSVNRQDLDGISIGASAGASVGLAGSMQLNMVGFGAAGESSGTLTGSGGGFTAASGFANQDRLSGSLSNDPTNNKLSSGDRGSVNTATRYNFGGAIGATSANSSTAKVVNSTLRLADATPTVSNGLNVSATTETAVRTIAGSAGVGLGGAGGALAITRVYNLVQANIDASTDIGARAGSVGPNVTVNGLATDKAGQWALFGSVAPSEGRQTVSSRAVAAGLGAVGISLAISDVKVDDVVTSTVSSNNFVAGNVQVAAIDNSDASSQSYGVSAGLGAVGLATSTLERTGGITAGATVGTSGTAASVYTMQVSAGEAGTLVSNVFAGSAGVGVAVQGNGANVIDNRNVGATLGAGSNLLVLGELDVQAVRSPELSTQVWGAALSGVAGLGVSATTALLAGNTTALIGAGSKLSGTGDVTVLAANTTPVDGHENVTAFAAAGAGGLFLGAAGSGASTSDTSSVSATIDNNTSLMNTGNVTIEADNGFASTAFASGVAVGFVGVGIVVSNSTATGTSLARLGDNITTSIDRMGDPYLDLDGGSITVITGGNRKTHAYALAGAGGLVAGAGASANSSQSGDSVVQIGAPIASPAPASPKALYADSIIARAAPTWTVGSATEAFQVSLLGASASVSRANVGSSSNLARARTEIGAGTIMAAQYIDLDAVQTTRSEIDKLSVPTPTGGALQFTSGSHFGENASGAGGGAVSFSGVDSVVNAYTGASTTVGNGAILNVYGNPTDLERVSRLRIGARSAGIVGNSVALDTGGLISVPNANSTTNVNQTTSVVLGDNTQLYSDGMIEIGTVNDTVSTAHSYVKVYGLASIGSSQADTIVNDTQKIAVGAGSSLFSWGDMRIMTGKHSDLTYSNDIAVQASADAFTGFVGTSDQHAYTTANFNAQVLIGGQSAGQMNGTSATLVSNRNITIGSDDGRIATSASGSSTSLLEQLFSSSSSDNKNIARPTSALLMNANMTAGARNSQIISIDANGNVTSKPADVDVTYVAANASGAFNPGAALAASIATLQGKVDAAQAAINQANADITTANATLPGLNAQLQPIRDQITTVTALPASQSRTDQLETLNEQLASVQATIDGVPGQVAALNAKITTLTGTKQDLADELATVKLVQTASNYGPNAVNSFSIGLSGRTPDMNNGIASGSKYALWASGGNIALQSRSVSGSGTLTANGGATIQIDSASPATLLIGDMSIPDLGPGGGTGGAITVSGGGSLTGSNLTIREVKRDVAPAITVLSTYKRLGAEDPGSVFISGFVNNLGGLYKVIKTSGNITMTGGYNAQTVDIEAPEGVLMLGNPSVLFPVGGNPESMWNDYLPTDNYANAALAAQLDLVNAYGAALGNSASGARFFNIGTSEYKGSVGSVYAWFGVQDPHSNAGGGANTVLSGRGNQSFLDFNQYNSGTYDYYRTLRLNSFVLPLNTGTGRTLSLSQSNTNSSVGYIAGKLAVIQGLQINVNGAVRAGGPSSYSININNNPITTYTQVVSGYIFGFPIYTQVASTIRPVDCLQDAACRPSIADRGIDGLWRIKGGYDVKTQAYTGLRAQFFTTLNSTDAPISVAYDAVKNEFVTDGVQGGGGGSVVLSGQIISTRQSNMSGSVTVNAGVSNVNIQNNTNLLLDTGLISPGAASAGVIQFTDKLKLDGSNRALKTFFVYNPGQAVQRYESYTATDWHDAALTNGSTTQYDPLSGMRYSWTRYLTESRTYTANNSGDQPYTHWILGAWNTTSGWTSDTLVARSVYRDTGDTSDYRQTFSLASITKPYAGGYGYSYHQDGAGTTRYYYIPTSFTLQSTSSVRADYPISIAFSGNATGSVNVSSNGGLRINGDINNLTGTTSLRANAGSLTTAADVTVQSRYLTLSSAGAIGGAASGAGAGDGYGYSGAFNAVMGASGTVKATAAGDVNLRLGGSSVTLDGTGLNSTGGTVTASLAQSLIGQTGSGAQVTGLSIKLLSDAGALGASGAALRLNSRNDNPIGLGATGVTALAQGSIYLDQLGGDLRVSTIASRTGDVWLRTPGSIVAIPDSSASSRSDSDLAGLWDKMALSGSAALATANANTVSPYEAGVTARYNEWWTLRDPSLGVYMPGSGGTAGSMTLNQTGLDALRSRAAVATGNGLPSDQDIRDFANGRLVQLETGFGTAIGSSWRSQSAFAAYSSSFSFTVSTAERAALTSGAVWDTNVLTNNINANALQGAPSGGVPLAPAAISGATVNLIAGLDIGVLLTPMIISTVQADGVTPLTSLTLTTEQKAALYRANTPGDVILHCSTGNVVDGACETGVLTSLEINRVRPLVVNNTQGLTVSPYSVSSPVRDVFLQSSGPLSVSQLVVSHDARLVAAQGVTATTPAGQLTFNIGNNLVLDGGSGGLGTAATPITYMTGGILQSARASGNVYLTTPNGSMIFGALGSDGNMVLRSFGSILSTATSLNLITGSLDAQAGVGATPGNTSSIGKSGSPLTIRLKGSTTGGVTTAGTLRAVAPGIVRIDMLQGDAVISTMTSASGDADLRSRDASAITVNGAVNAAGTVRLLSATGALSFNAGGTVNGVAGVEAGGKSVNMINGSSITSSGGNVSLAAYTGDMTVTRVTGNSVMATAFTGAINAAAGTGVADNFFATAGNGQVALNQANLWTTNSPYGRGIGTASQPLRVNAASFYGTTANGLVNVNLTALNTAAQNIESGDSGVTVVSSGNLTAQKVSGGGMGGVAGTKGGSVNITAAGNLNVLNALAVNPTGGSPVSTLSASAGGTASFNTITAPGAISVLAANTSIGNAITQGTFTARGTTRLSLGSLTAGGNTSLNAASGAMTVGNATITNGSMTAVAGSTGGTIGGVSASNGISLTGGGWTVGTLTSSSNLADISIAAGTGGIQYGLLISGRDIVLGATGGGIAAQSTSTAIGRNISMSGISAQLGNVYATQSAGVGGSLLIDTTVGTGDLSAGTLSSYGATLKSGRDLSVGTVDSAGGAVVASAVRYLTVGRVVAQSATLSSQLDAAVNSLTTSAFANVTSAGASTIVRNASVGTTANFSAGTLLDVTTATAGGNMALTGGSMSRVSGAVASTGGTMSLIANSGTVQMTAGSTLRSAGAMTVRGTALNLTNLATTTTLGDILLAANGAGTTGAITFNAIASLRDITLSATGAVTGTGAGNLLKAGGKITGSALSISGAAIEVGAATPGTLSSSNNTVAYASGGSLVSTGGTIAFTTKTNITNAPAAPAPAPATGGRR